MKPSRDIEVLLAIMAALRTPGTGCPWDLEQSFETIVPYTLEEAYEVADAIERRDFLDLRDELGDLLLQVVFHARMAEEEGLFAFGDVVQAITAKLIRRHPHVFGEARDLAPEAVKALWHDIKRQEKDERRRERSTAGEEEDAPRGLLADVPKVLPALTRAEKLQRKAATVGFDWTDRRAVVDKIREELREVEETLDSTDRAAQQDEIGDLLFAVANLARHLEIDAEAALRGTNTKFERRFRFIEQVVEGQGASMADVSLEDMEDIWQEAKRREREGA
ncbi:nucleoside triphosphate pyrophosphohydrolase [Chelatococcus daeguensis]|uniref:nucleoside triphosphate pyrophosphohydrolase n=1 Tax=Chelatococcus daeguensis TaxID=444444 RepID=UPI0007AB52CA|nr:nucleoside triphosphate pyrophosphohydrolase [Chelatococcus daeguensis]KZE35467.1 nucleoside triphosphate hydrolase [Chelatococcus daeguensis]MBM3085459.1 nucleoside triphosphate pyrophosphohydrolase [Chelatococcus daeguensis]